MKENKLTIHIEKPVNQVFEYTITPPNSRYWVPGVTDEKTSDWPVRVGSTYFEKMKDGGWLGYYVFPLRKMSFLSWSRKMGITTLGTLINR